MAIPMLKLSEGGCIASFFNSFLLSLEGYCLLVHTLLRSDDTIKFYGALVCSNFKDSGNGPRGHHERNSVVAAAACTIVANASGKKES